MRNTARKLMAAALSLTMLSAMYLPASAADDNIATVGGSASKDVKATYVSSGTVYSIDIAWGNMEFNYNSTGKTWDANNLEYTGDSTPKWECAEEGGNAVTVTNKSNAAVKATVTFKGEDADNETILTDITGEVENGTFELASAEGGTDTDGTATLTITGGEISSTASNVTIGKITVTVDDVDDDNTAGGN